MAAVGTEHSSKSIELPTISVCMATLNAESVLTECLRCLAEQDYPRDRVELIVGDGGSSDGTVALVESHGGRVFDNPLKTGESGKAVAVSKAQNELVLILDSDNFLPTTDWLRQMAAPFADAKIQLAEPIAYTWRREGGCIERYSALIGMNDPLCHFIGNYDRHNTLTGRWTDVEHHEEDRGDYLFVTLTAIILVPHR